MTEGEIGRRGERKGMEGEEEGEMGVFCVH